LSTRPLRNRAGAFGRLACSAVLALAACGEVAVDGDSDADPGGGGDADGAPLPGDEDASPNVPDARPPGECNGGITQLLTNPGFDEAMMPGGAIGWTETTVPITYPVPQIPISHSPIRAAWFGEIIRPEQKLSQEVSVPEGTNSLALTIYTCFVTAEKRGEVFDRVSINLLDSSGNPLEVLAEFDNTMAGETCGWQERTLLADNPHAGQEVRLEIFGQSDGATLTSFYFDTLSLNATGTCPDGGS
jgi:hypothetical protein